MPGGRCLIQYAMLLRFAWLHFIARWVSVKNRKRTRSVAAPATVPGRENAAAAAMAAAPDFKPLFVG